MQVRDAMASPVLVGRDDLLDARRPAARRRRRTATATCSSWPARPASARRACSRSVGRARRTLRLRRRPGGRLPGRRGGLRRAAARPGRRPATRPRRRDPGGRPGGWRVGCAPRSPWPATRTGSGACSCRTWPTPWPSSTRPGRCWSSWRTCTGLTSSAWRSSGTSPRRPATAAPCSSSARTAATSSTRAPRCGSGGPGCCPSASRRRSGCAGSRRRRPRPWPAAVLGPAGAGADRRGPARAQRRHPAARGGAARRGGRRRRRRDDPSGRPGRRPGRTRRPGHPRRRSARPGRRAGPRSTRGRGRGGGHRPLLRLRPPHCGHRRRPGPSSTGRCASCRSSTSSRPAPMR